MKRPNSWMKHYSVKTMSSNGTEQKYLDTLPGDFFYQFLKSRGAELEISRYGYNALLPGELSSILDLPELAFIQNHQLHGTGHSDPDLSPGIPDAVYAVHYGSSLLDKAVSMVCDKIPVLLFRLHFDYLKSQGFDKLVRNRFVFPNGVGKLVDHAEVQVQYILITCWYSALSDEQKEGLVTLTFSLENGACIPDMESSLSAAQRSVLHSHPEENADNIQKVLRYAPGVFQERITIDTMEFRESMKRRFRRDVQNLTEYYEGLKREMEKSLERPGLSGQLIMDRKEKIRLIPDELIRKKEDLQKKYSMKISIKPCSIIHVKTPAIKLLYRVSIGKSQKNFSMIYNPVVKDLDPQVCDSCGVSTYSCTFCDRLHMLCPACSGNCALCGK